MHDDSPMPAEIRTAAAACPILIRRSLLNSIDLDSAYAFRRVHRTVEGRSRVPRRSVLQLCTQRIVALSFLLLVPGAAGAALTELVEAVGGDESMTRPHQKNDVRVRVNADTAFLMKPGEEARVSVAKRNFRIVVFERYIDHASGNRSWIGRLKGESRAYRTIITNGPTGSFGLFVLPDGEYHLTTRSGVQTISRPRADSEGQDAYFDDVVPLPLGSEQVHQPIGHFFEKAKATSEKATIDLMILYTPTLPSRYGASLQARLDHLIAIANQSYEDSGVHIALRLVHTEQVNYSESADSLTALGELAKSENPRSSAAADPSLANVGALRRRYGADLVTMIRPLHRAHSPGSSRAYFAVGRNNTTGQLVGYPAAAYSVVSEGEAVDSPGFMAFESNLVHEIGHNLGSHHNREHANGPGVFPYSHGYGITGLFATIMAHSYIQAPREYKFSGPALSCSGGACGIDENDPVSGANNVLSQNNVRFVVAAFMPAADAPSETINIVEYYHAQFDHYFITSLPDEIGKLDNGTIAGWRRTGGNLKGLKVGTAGADNVCRFFSAAFAPKSSHFYTALNWECGTVKSNRDWSFEGEVFSVVSVSATGSCPPGSSPVYRLYNNGQGGAPNHRFTNDWTTRADMLMRGWIAEGAGSVGVAFCSPI